MRNLPQWTSKGNLIALKPTPGDLKIRGTYSTTYLFNVYSAGVQHVQGIAQLSDGRFVLSHDSRSDRQGFVAVSNGRNDTVFVDIPAGDHPGAMQAAGKIVAVPSKDKGTYFLDARNPAAPTFNGLRHLWVPATGLNAAGLAYIPSEDRHFLITTTTAESGSGNVTLYKSKKGMSLFDTSNTFEYVNFFPTTTSQGGTQLLLDKRGQIYVAAFYRVSGVETITLSKVSGIGGATPSATHYNTISLSDSGSDTSYSAGFRWGGTVALMNLNLLNPKAPPTTVAIGVERVLTNGPAEQFSKLKIWVP